MYIKDKDFLVAFKLMEGTPASNVKGHHGPCYAIENFDRQREEHIQYELDMGEFLGKVDMGYSIQTIYGDGGWNRYYVLASGEVVFSKRHNSNENRHQDATDLGFRLWS